MKLAIEGGPKVRTAPWPGRAHLGEDDIEAVVRVMRRGVDALDRYSPDSEVVVFEQEMAAFYGTKYAVGSTSGTAAIHIALGAGRFDVGGEVITSPVTDPGAVNPILMQNLVPVFADVDYDTCNISPTSVEERITDRTVAIIVTHLSGVPADMEPILALARERGILVIEDCAQAHGARYQGRYVGSIGDMGCFSLMQGKHTTTAGQGGITLTQDQDLYENAMRFADRGKPIGLQAPGNVFLGLNYRMTAIQAAMGRTQLKKLPGIASRRRELGRMLGERLAEESQTVRLQKEYPGSEPSYWVVPLRVDPDRIRVDGIRFGAAVSAEGVPASASYARLILYRFPYFTQRATYGKSQCPWSCPYYGRDIEYEGSCPNAEKAVTTMLRVGLHENCGEREIEDIVAAIKKVEAAYIK